ncbi:ABC transporter permease [Nanoarchaeota archaeon]
MGVIRTSIKESLAYKFEFFATIIVAPITLLVFYYLWSAIFGATGEVIAGFNFEEMITYYVLIWIVGIFTYTNIEQELRYLVRSGQLVRDLLKPNKFVNHTFCVTIGNRLFAVVAEMIPLLIISFIFLPMTVDYTYLPLFLFSLIIAFLLTFLFYFISGMSAFWLINNNGILKMRRILYVYLSGGVLPLTFFPDWFQAISHYLPFQYLIFVPANIWLGRYTLPQIGELMLIAIIWIFIFYWIYTMIWRKAMGKIAAVGI